MQVEGTVDSGFAAVRDVFVRNFAEEGEVGAAIAVYVDGRKVVDLWGGLTDTETRRPWAQETLCGFYSTGKPIAATLLLRELAMRGIGLESPVAEVWPEFGAAGNGAAGKARISFRQLLCHQSGLPAVRERLPEGAMLDWSLMTSALARQSPWFEPGSRHVYHTNTYGFLLGEPLRRLTGLSPGEYLQRHVAGPLGESIFFGVPAGRLDDCATLYWQGGGAAGDTRALDWPMTEEERMLRHGLMNPSGLSSLGVMNTTAWRQAQVPSTNGHGTARAVARFYSELTHPSLPLPLLDAGTLAEATRLQSSGYCPALERGVDFGLGFQLTRPDRPLGPGVRSYGHYGTGGSLGFADPDAHIGFGYVMNHIIPRWQNPRNRALADAVYSCL